MKKKQTSGSHSINYQADNISIQKGISARDVIDISEKIFEQNFPKLVNAAKEEIKKRNIHLLKELAKIVEEKLSKKDLESFMEPDIQYNLNSIMIKNARYNSKYLREFLLKLLVFRIKNKDSDILKIVLNEAIATIDKLTLNQIKLLTATFLIRRAIKANIKTERNFKEDFISLFENFEDYDVKLTDHEHLSYLSCVNHSVANWNLYEILKKNYPEVLGKKNNEEIKEIILETKGGKIMFSLYEKSNMKHYSLTSIGLAIGILYTDKLEDSEMDFTKWIN